MHVQKVEDFSQIVDHENNYKTPLLINSRKTQLIKSRKGFCWIVIICEDIFAIFIYIEIAIML